MGGVLVKKIAVVNDLSGFGRCSLTAALPVLSVLRTQACPLPTAILSNQTGYPQYFCDDFTDRFDRYVAQWARNGVCFDGILTGFLASAAQVEQVERFLEEFQTENTLYVCDPVMADDGALYASYDESYRQEMRRLAARANVLTPNLTELCFLTDTPYPTLLEKSLSDGGDAAVAETAAALLTDTLQTVVVTGVFHDTEIRNIAVTCDGFTVTAGKRYGGSFSGTGDLFSAALAGYLVRGRSVGLAVERAVRFLEASIRDSYLAGDDRNAGVNFENYLEMLL